MRTAQTTAVYDKGLTVMERMFGSDWATAYLATIFFPAEGAAAP